MDSNENPEPAVAKRLGSGSAAVPKRRFDYDLFVSDIEELVWQEDLQPECKIPDNPFSQFQDSVSFEEFAASIPEENSANELGSPVILDLPPASEAGITENNLASGSSSKTLVPDGFEYSTVGVAEIVPDELLKTDPEYGAPFHCIDPINTAVFNPYEPVEYSSGPCAPYYEEIPPAFWHHAPVSDDHGDTLENVTRNPAKQAVPLTVPWHLEEHNVPLIQITKCAAFSKLRWKFFMKCAFRSPTGSIKDQVALDILKFCLRNERPFPYEGTTMIVPYSASLAVSLALIGVHSGFKVITVVANESQNYQKLQILEQLGGSVVITHGQAVYWESRNIQRFTPDSFIIDEYLWSHNVIHYYSKMADEIINNFPGQVHMVICTSEAAGLAQSIKHKHENCIIIGAQLPEDAAESDVSNGIPRARMITRELDYFYGAIEGMQDIRYEEAIKMAAYIEQHEGISLSPSSGAVIAGALKTSSINHCDFRRKLNVVLLLDENVQFLNPDTSFLSEFCILKRPQKPIVQKWWNLLNMSHIAFSPPEMISSSFSIAFALERMVADGTDHMIILDEAHLPIAIAVREDLEDAMENPRFEPLTSCKVCSKKFTTCSLSTTFGQVMNRIQTTACRFVILTQRHPCYNAADPQGIGSCDYIVGFMTAQKIRDYARFFETEHPFNTNVHQISGVPLGDHVWELP